MTAIEWVAALFTLFMVVVLPILRGERDYRQFRSINEHQSYIRTLRKMYNNKEVK